MPPKAAAYRVLLDQFDNSTHADDDDELSDEDTKRLLLALSRGLLNQQTNLQHLRRASTHEVNVSINLLDPEAWEDILTSPLAVTRGETFLRTFFSRVLSSRTIGTSAEAMLTALVHLMNLAVLQTDLCQSINFTAVARTLITELMVAKESLNEVKPSALAAFRGSLMESELPPNLQRAYAHTRLHEKISQPEPKPNAGKRQRGFQTQNRGNGRGRGGRGGGAGRGRGAQPAEE